MDSSQSLRGDQVFLGFAVFEEMFDAPSSGLNPSVVIRSFWGENCPATGRTFLRLNPSVVIRSFWGLASADEVAEAIKKSQSLRGDQVFLGPDAAP